MTDTRTRQYTFSLPEDTADLFDKFCREQPKSPVDNIASRLISSGIETVLMLHPDWQERLDYEPHKMSEAARLSEALRAELDDAKAEIGRKDAALKVFADCADLLDEETRETGREWPDDEWAKFRLLVSDYRNARQALKGSSQ